MYNSEIRTFKQKILKLGKWYSLKTEGYYPAWTDNMKY